jgi:FkbM family methyltransferase
MSIAMSFLMVIRLLLLTSSHALRLDPTSTQSPFLDSNKNKLENWAAIMNGISGTKEMILYNLDSGAYAGNKNYLRKMLPPQEDWGEVLDKLIGGLNFPSGNHKLFIDVGLETGSALACLLENSPDLVVLAFEAFPPNFRVSYENTMKSIPEHVKNRIHVLPLAVSDNNTFVTFNANYAPACGSILPSKEDAWWCAQTANQTTVPAVRLDFIMDLLALKGGLRLSYVKTDVEGADLLALKGLGKYVDIVTHIAFECPIRAHQNNARIGNCVQDEALPFLADHGFKSIKCDDTDCFAGRDSDEQAEYSKCMHHGFGHLTFTGSCGRRDECKHASFGMLGKP